MDRAKPRAGPFAGQASWQALHPAQDASTLRLDPLAGQSAARQGRSQALNAKPWVVYAKTPLAGPAAALDDLSRYTHRTAIGNERLLGISGDKVRFKTRVNRKAPDDPVNPPGNPPGDRPRSSVTTLAGTEFVSRLMQHVVLAGSSASATMACWHPRPRPNDWPPRGPCWPCRRPTRRWPRRCATSCGAWPASTSRNARTAAAGDGCQRPA
ncbi:MAG: transposase [Burkholderiaceae bacterium]|nr:transposase [Burkholderiaceae bacterium]